LRFFVIGRSILVDEIELILDDKACFVENAIIKINYIHKFLSCASGKRRKIVKEYCTLL
jgi:hypothetical protein